jgi:hypothetical protein
LRSSREVRAAAVGLACISLYTFAVLLTGRVDVADFLQLLALYLHASFLLWTALGLVWILVLLYRRRPRNGAGESPIRVIGDEVARRWERDRGVSLFWPPLMFALLIASFNAFKQMVLPLAGFHFDPLLAQLDRALFFGTDPWRVTHALFGSPSQILLIDRAYHGWFAPMLLGVVLCAWLPESMFRQRTQYLLTYVGVWVVIGSILAFVVPSAGPCFFDTLAGSPPQFRDLMARLSDAQAKLGVPLQALRNQELLLHLRGSSDLAVGGGISAMPSVHNGLAALFAIGGFQINRALGYILTAYAALIWIGSIHLGWHYALDGVVGIVLTFGIWHVCGRVAERLERPLFSPESQPAIA